MLPAGLPHDEEVARWAGCYARRRGSTSVGDLGVAALASDLLPAWESGVFVAERGGSVKKPRHLSDTDAKRFKRYVLDGPPLPRRARSEPDTKPKTRTRSDRPGSITLWLTAEEKARMHDRAEEEGKRLNRWALDTLIAAAVKP